MSRTKLEPDASHPITVTPTEGRVVVRRGDTIVADTTRALTLQEASYPAVQYVPLADVDPTIVERTDHTSWCPFKGEAGYWSLVVDGERVENAVWGYDAPHNDVVAPIAGHVAFYPDQVEVSVDVTPR